MCFNELTQFVLISFEGIDLDLNYLKNGTKKQNKNSVFWSVCTINSKINGTPKGVYTSHFEDTFYFSTSEFNRIGYFKNRIKHNNIALSYYNYGQVNSLRLKSNVASKWASKHIWGYHLFCCWRYISLRKINLSVLQLMQFHVCTMYIRHNFLHLFFVLWDKTIEQRKCFCYALKIGQNFILKIIFYAFIIL